MESPLSNGVTAVFLWNVMAEKSAVYDNELLLLLLGTVSLITTLSYFLSLVTTLKQNLRQIRLFKRKNFFSRVFFEKQAKAPLTTL